MNYSFSAQEQLWFFTLILTIPRILGTFLAMPFLGNTVLPGLARNAIVIALAAFAAPITHGYVAEVPMDTLQIGFIIIKETAIGFMMGYMIGVPFWAVASAGFWVDLQSGKMSAQMFSNVLADTTSPLGDLLAKLAVTLLFTTGGFFIIVEILLKSYHIWPVHTFLPSMDIGGASFFLKQFALIFSVSVLIGGPIIATMFIVELGAAIITRYVPQLNVFILMMPIKAGIAALLMIYYVTYISRYLMDSFLKYGDSFQILEGVFK